MKLFGIRARTALKQPTHTSIRRSFVSSINSVVEQPCNDASLTDMDIIREGKATILKSMIIDEGRRSQEVFYNPVQRMNRDISLLFYLAWSQKVKLRDNDRRISYLDAFTASGLRAIRLKKEMPAGLIDQIVACDLSAEAIEFARHNLGLNDISR
jgi:tRNA G26 N,N-dimethylase Trm1